MQRFDRLEVPGGHPVFMSGHPLEGVALKVELRPALDRFIHATAELGIRGVTVLLSDDEITGSYEDIDLLEEYRRAGLEVVHFPLENFSTPADIKLFDQLTERLGKALSKGPLLIHCRTGCGRTALVAAGVLIKQGVPAPRAIHAVHTSRPSSNPTINQVQFLRDYHAYLSSRKP